jgi:hypothetical protein
MNMNPKLCGLQQDKGSSTNAFMDEGGARCGSRLRYDLPYVTRYAGGIHGASVTYAINFCPT